MTMKALRQLARNSLPVAEVVRLRRGWQFAEVSRLRLQADYFPRTALVQLPDMNLAATGTGGEQLAIRAHDHGYCRDVARERFETARGFSALNLQDGHGAAHGEYQRLFFAWNHRDGPQCPVSRNRDRTFFPQKHQIETGSFHKPR